MTRKWIFLIIPFIFLSCKPEDLTDRDESQNDDTFRANDELRPSRKYTDVEFEIGKRVCTNLKYKRQVLSLSRDGDKKYNFKVQERDCLAVGSRTISAGASLRTSSSELRFDSRSDIIETVLTDEDEIMNIFCSDLLAGSNRENIHDDGSLRYMVSFYEKSRNDYVLIGKFLEERGKWRAKFVDESNVAKSNLGSYPRGSVARRTQEFSCSGSRNTSILTQELLN